jgi:hypothetical protein
MFGGFFANIQSISIDPFAQAFIDAHETNTGVAMGNVQKATIIAVTAMLRGNGTTNGTDFISDNLLYRWQCYCPIDDSTANPAAYEMDLINPALKHSFLNLSSSLYDPTGMRINGSSGRGIDSMFNPFTEASPTDFTFGYNFKTSSTGTINSIGSRGTGATQYTTTTKFSGKLLSGIAETADSTSFTYPNLPAGFLNITVSGTTKKVWLDGSLLNTTTRTGTSFYNGNIAFQSCNTLGNIGPSTSTVDGRLCIGSFLAKGFTDTQATDFNEVWSYYQSNIITGGR